MKKAKIDNKKLIIGIILTTLVLVIGTSYAFFTLTLRGEKDLTVISGTLALQYKDQNVINLEKAYPISDQEGMNLLPYEFSVENTGDIRALYDIILEENEENTLNSVWLKYSIKRNEEEWSTPRKISSLKLEEGLEVEPGETDVYQLRLWIDEEVGNEAQNKSFKARVVINSTQSNASTSDLTPPVITLNGSLSENVEQGEIYTDPGVASVRDDRDTLEISEVKVSYKYFDGESTTNVEEIDTSKIGVYYIYYKLKDTKGNEGRIIRSVNVYQKNTNVPVIKLNGKSMITIEKGRRYIELGATASKNGEDLTSKIVIQGEVNVNQAGVYEIRYVVRDDEGNTASIVRVVNVVYVKEGQSNEITIDLTENPSEKVTLEGENLGEVTYTSSDESIASVDVDGTVTGVTPGEVTIHIVTSTGVTKEVHVKVVKTVSVSYVKQGSGVESIGKESDSCTITTKGGSCEVSLPTITSSAGYNTRFWSTSNESTSGTEAGTIIRFSENVTYYARALDTIKPIWSLVSTNPASGTIVPTDTLVITFKGTDTSGSVMSTLVAEDITVQSGSTTITPTTKILSNASNVIDGKEYSLTLSGFHVNGVLSITISESTLKDESNNVNNVAVLTTSVIIKNPGSNLLINKANPTTLNYNNATDSQKKEMFTFTHTAGIQQSGWSASELTDYRYIGKNSNNYVTFNGELWRIIGVFTAEDENGKKEKRIKLIREAPLRNYSWDTTGANGANNWNSSALQKVLNSGIYYNRQSGSCPSGSNGATTPCDFSNIGLTGVAKSMIGKTKWYLGGWNTEAITASKFYEYERGTTVYSGRPTSWTGEVGLMYPSDYGYAASGSSCLSTNLNSYHSNCASTNWLYNSESQLRWTITPMSSDSRYVFVTHSSGKMTTGYTSYNIIYVRPSIYLKFSVSIIGGDGSSSNPYQLEV